MRLLRRVRSDLLAGKNIDVYAILAISLVLVGLSLLGIASASLVASVTLAVLAILAVGALQDRTLLERTSISINRSPHSFFLPDFPPTLKEQREAADELYLMGVSLSRTIRTSYSALEQMLRAGKKVRVLLTDPKAEASAIEVRSIYRGDVDRRRKDIEGSLEDLRRLKADTNGPLEVRTTRAALTFGSNFINPGSAEPVLCVQHYSYRLKGESRPIFVLTRNDGLWFECYRDEAENHWQDAAQVP